MFECFFFFSIRSSACWSWVGEVLNSWLTTNAIFYRHDLLSLQSTKTFWFSEDSTKALAAWGAKNPRGCTSARFQHMKTKQMFVVFNVHLDFPCAKARHHSIPILLAEIGGNKEEVIVIGDFNNWPEEKEGDTPLEELIPKGQKASEILQMKEAGFVDTYHHGETPTFNGFRSTGYGPKIDFIWIAAKSVYRVHGETKVDDFHDENGHFPSDHFPVYTDFIRSSSKE